MSGNKCEYLNCGKNKRLQKDLKMFRFPYKNKTLCEAWISNSGNSALNGLDATILQGKYICSDHFAETDYKTDKKRFIKQDAVPKNYIFADDDQLKVIGPNKTYFNRKTLLIQSAPTTDNIVQQALATSYQNSTQPIKTEPSDTMQDNVVIKIEEGSSTDSAEESISIISNERDTLPEAMPASKSSFIPTQSKTMTRPLNSSAVKNALVADEAEQKAEYIARRTLEQNKEKMRSLRRKNRQLKRKIEKINNIFNELGKQCDINEVSKQLSIIPCSSNPISEDSSTESDVDEPYRLDNNLQENVKVNVVTNKSDVAVADNEEAATQINCHNMESQVQVTFLAGSDTAKEGLLKRKLKQLAENDVIKSKKIRELHNILFVKNKLIAELKSEIAQLKEFQKNQVQRPIIQYIVRKS